MYVYFKKFIVERKLPSEKLPGEKLPGEKLPGEKETSQWEKSFPVRRELPVGKGAS